jgi:protein-disulfide isomerase
MKKALLAVALTTLLPVNAQNGATRKQGDDMVAELQRIRQLLEARQAAIVAAPSQAPPLRAQLSVGERPMLGNKAAPLTIVEFTDYQCPFCRQFHISVFPQLKKDYIDAGKVRFYSKDLPLDGHSNAMRAAQAGRCAGEHGQFWGLRDAMTRNADKLELPNILFWATNLNMDSAAVASCIESAKYQTSVEQDVAEALRIGVTGTPAFVIGRSITDGVEGELVVGALSFPGFASKLDQLDSRNPKQ